MIVRAKYSRKYVIIHSIINSNDVAIKRRQKWNMEVVKSIVFSVALTTSEELLLIEILTALSISLWSFPICYKRKKDQKRSVVVMIDTLLKGEYTVQLGIKLICFNRYRDHLKIFLEITKDILIIIITTYKHVTPCFIN